MDALRISLLIVGGLIVLAIYLYGRRHLQMENRNMDLPRKATWMRLFSRLRKHLTQLKTRTASRPARAAPVVSPDMIDATDLDALETIVAQRDSGRTDIADVPVAVELTSDQIAPAGEQLFIPLTIMAGEGRSLAGETILQATQQSVMHLAPNGVFHYDVEDTHGYRQPLLGLANILEPGTFDNTTLQTLTTPGLVLYLHLPAPLEARQAFDKLIEVGQQLAGALDAELCDETRSALTRQTIGHLREKIEAFRFKQKMTQIKRHRQ